MDNENKVILHAATASIQRGTRKDHKSKWMGQQTLEDKVKKKQQRENKQVKQASCLKLKAISTKCKRTLNP